MRILLTADLHLTERANDSYRWDFLEHWILEQNFDSLVILGDLADEKDYHSAYLVNRIVRLLLSLVEARKEIHLLKGNHDYLIPAHPFFEFISFYPRCYYYTKPRLVEIGNLRWAFFPHAKKPDFGNIQKYNDVGIDFVGCHQLFNGSIGESGRKLSGENADIFKGAPKVWAGDVHCPQIIGPVEYVGAPYPIHFGDNFKPRVVLIDGHSWRNLYPPSLQKVSLRISDPDELEFSSAWKSGDQIKIELLLSRSEFGLWRKYRKSIQRMCKRQNLLLCGLTLIEKKRPTLDKESTRPNRGYLQSPKEQFNAYCKSTHIDHSDITIGRDLL